jgi:hypothetical protein
MFDLVDTDDEEMVSILSITSSEMLLQRLTHHGRNSIIDDHNNDSNNNNNSNMVESKNKAQEELTDCEASFRSVNKFIWDQCLPDQMFVFAEEEIEHILNVSITDLKLPMKSRSEIYVPANIIFLSARFAHYFTSREILHSLLNSSIQRIGRVVKVSQ